MINGLNGGCKTAKILLTSLDIYIYIKDGDTVWTYGDHGDEGPGCKPQRNGDLWT